MISVRQSNERGHANHGWLDTYHSFSFADYHDPKHMGFSVLRVINEDEIAPGAGFPTHSHRDMEIVTYILEGALEHRDSLGNGSIIRRGDVQRMSAGTGVSHSEFNASTRDRVHLLQIWIVPNIQGVTPEYEQAHLSDEEKRNRLRLVVSPDGRQGSLKMHQDAFIYAGLLEPDNALTHRPHPGRKAYVQVARGELDLNGKLLDAGDGAMMTDETRLTLSARVPAEVLLFDLP